MKLDFVSSVGSLSRDDKINFYTDLAYSLTVSSRAVWSDPSYTAQQQVEHMRWINEAQHRVLNHLLDLQLGRDDWTEAKMWDTLEHIAHQDREAAGHIRAALRSAYQWAGLGSTREQ